MKQESSYQRLSVGDVLERYPFQPAIKVAPTRIKPITEQDIALLGATFRDLEGREQCVEPGRFLCVGVQGERWTCGAASMSERVAISEPDEEGFRWYRQREPRPVLVAIIPEPFLLEVHGKTWKSQPDGGVVTWNGQTGPALMMRVIAPDIFAQTYQLLQPSRQPQHHVTVDLLIVHPASQSVLLIQRRKEPFQGRWALPGGHVEVSRQETLEQAARRELREETGLECSASWALHQLRAFGDPGRDPRGPSVSVLYGALADTPEQPSALAGDDAGAVAWFPLHALPPLAFDHSQMLQQVRPLGDQLARAKKGDQA